MFQTKVPFKYRTPQDCETRLGGAVYMFDGMPRRLQYEENKVRVYDIDGTIIESVKPDDPRIDIASIELGYVNSYQRGIGGSYPEMTAVFMTRTPSKQWRQGIYPSNTRVYLWDGSQVSCVREHLIFSKSFEEFCLGKFPSVVELQHRLKPGWSAAISKDICLYKAEFGVLGVYYRCNPVGYFGPDKKVTFSGSLPEWFMKEVMENVLEMS